MSSVAAYAARDDQAPHHWTGHEELSRYVGARLHVLEVMLQHGEEDVWDRLGIEFGPFASSYLSIVALECFHDVRIL